MGKQPFSLDQFTKNAVPNFCHGSIFSCFVVRRIIFIVALVSVFRSCTGSDLVPRTAIAFIFFDPSTAPVPHLPACLPKSWVTQEKAMPFSAAGPMVAI